MKTLVCLFALIVIALVACDQGSEMLKPVMKEVMTDGLQVPQPTEPIYTYVGFRPEENMLTPINHPREWDAFDDEIWQKTRNGFYYHWRFATNQWELSGSPSVGEHDDKFKHWFNAVSGGKIIYDLSGEDYSKFEGYAAIKWYKETCGGVGSVQFFFLIDDIGVSRTNILRGAHGAQPVRVEFDIPTDAQTLTIVVSDAGHIDCDHWVIGDARLTSNVPVVYSQYDVNQDGNVDNTDLTLVSAAVGETNPTNPRLDVDGNGAVDGTDVILVSKNSGKADTTILQDTAVMQPTAPTAKPGITAITFENAINLMSGERYRLRPLELGTITLDLVDFLNSISWDNIDYSESDFGEAFPEGAHKVYVHIELDPKPFLYSVEGVQVIEAESLYPIKYDEILIEIIEKTKETQNRLGDIFVEYKAVAIENLTNPDRKFEYKE